MVVVARAANLSGIRVFDTRCRRDDAGTPPPESFRGEMIAFVRSGTFLFERRGETHVADPLHVLFFNLDDDCAMRHPHGFGDECTVLALSDDAARQAAAAIGLRDRRRGTVPTTAELDLRFRLLTELLRCGNTLELEEHALRLSMAALGLRTVAEPASRPARAETRDWHEELVRRARLELAANLDTRLSLATVARRVGTSPFHLCRIFPRHAGVTLQRYHRRLRLRAGLQAILDGARDLTAVAMSLGFFDHTHFTKSFRNEYGIAPSGCRRQLRSLANRSRARPGQSV